MENSLLVLAAIMAITGVIGNIMPALPGTPLNFASLLLLYYATGGSAIGVPMLVFMGLLTAGAVVFDLIVPLYTARRFGATRYGIYGSLAGMLAVLVLFWLPGMFIGMILGAVAGELVAGKKSGEAVRAGAGALVGNVLAALMRVGVSATMATVFFVYLVAHITAN